jgi:hypothetical protein
MELLPNLNQPLLEKHREIAEQIDNLLIAAQDSAWKEAIKAFYAEVCRRAENKMLETHKLEGAHYASMREIMQELGLKI